MSLDDATLSPAEQRYFSSGGQDIGGVLAEAGRSTAAEPDGPPELSAAEKHYFSSSGDASAVLAEAASRAAPRTEVRLPPAAQAMFDRVLAAHQGERVEHARTSARLDLLQEALTPPPAPAPEPPPRLDPERDIFAYIRNVGERLDHYESERNSATAEIDLRRAYHADGEQFQRSHPDLLNAYVHLMASRDAELQTSMPDKAQRHAHIEAEERQLIRDAFNRGTSPMAEIYRMATFRGYVSPAQREAAAKSYAEGQRRQREAAAEAKRKLADDEWSWRAGVARKLSVMSPDEYHDWLISGRSREDRRRYFDRPNG
jgi:hypothetical protein